jgi:hypothetical protein
MKTLLACKNAQPYIQDTAARHRSLHRLQIRRHFKRGVSLALHLLHSHTWRDFGQSKGALLTVDLEDALPMCVSARGSSRVDPLCQLTRSVMMVLTTRAPVSGRLQSWTILDDPSLATWSVATTILVLSGLETRSIAPPMPLNTLPGIM